MGLHNQKHYLTSPSEGVLNDGLDNKENNLILYTDLILVNSDTNMQYAVKSMLGQGAFGQVCQCSASDPRFQQDVAVKVVKNSPVYYSQGESEITICRHLKNCDPHDKHHIVRILDYFQFAGHWCLVFELMSKNLYELLKENENKGLSMRLVRRFTRQILVALTALQGAGVIHCDLKPENILLQPCLTDEAIKLIDFGSSCMEVHRPGFRCSYIQSRHYRSPEVLLHMSYSRAIDMWSLGCVAAELFLGIPLFPGECEYDVLRFMLEVLGCQPPDYMIRQHHTKKESFKYFKFIGDAPVSEDMAIDGEQSSAYRFLSEAEVEARERERQVVAREWEKSKVGRRYFGSKKLEDIILKCRIQKQKITEEEINEEIDCRVAFVHFLKGILNFEPTKRWTPRQALLHPFVTGQPFSGHFTPPPERIRDPRDPQVIMFEHNGATGYCRAGSPQEGQTFSTPIPIHHRNSGYQTPTGFNSGVMGSTGVYGLLGPGAGLLASPDVYYHDGKTFTGLSPSHYQLVALGATVPQHHPNQGSNALSSPTSHFLQSPIFSASSPGSNPYMSPSSQLNLSPRSPLSHNSPNRLSSSSLSLSSGSLSHTSPNRLSSSTVSHSSPNRLSNSSMSHNSPSRQSSSTMSHSSPNRPSSSSLPHSSPSRLSSSSSQPHNSPSRLSPYNRAGGGMAQNMSYLNMIRNSQHAAQQQQWPSQQHPHANGNAFHGSGLPPRNRNGPGLPHFPRPASFSRTGGSSRSLGAMLQLPDNPLPPYVAPEDAGEVAPGYSTEQFLGDSGELSTPSHPSPVDVKKVSDEISRLRTKSF